MYIEPSGIVADMFVSHTPSLDHLVLIQLRIAYACSEALISNMHGLFKTQKASQPLPMHSLGEQRGMGWGGGLDTELMPLGGSSQTVGTRSC